MRAYSKETVTRWLHKLYWVVIALVYLHALAVGTEAQSSTGLLFYGLLGVLIAVLLLASLIRSLGAKPEYIQ
jgi:hypothetical protein